MTISEAKRLKVGDRVGCRLYGEDGIILDINKIDDKNIVFRIVFETYGVTDIKHKDLNKRVIFMSSFNCKKGFFSFEDSLFCPSILRLEIENISNEEILKLWKMEDVYSKYLS